MKADEQSRLGVRRWPKRAKSMRSFVLAIAILLGGLIALYWSGDSGVFQRKGLSTSAAGVLVLEDADSDFRKPPFADTVIMFGRDGKPVRKVSNLNICETVGGCRALSVASDGRFFVVCEKD